MLESIIENTRLEIVRAKRMMPAGRLMEMSGYTRRCYSLQAALSASRPAVIAEVKKASPSRGVIRTDFDPVRIACSFAKAGASAISILTDRKFFQGDIQYIADIRPVISVPILRKDFIIDSYQLVEAKAFGADVVLLIAAALNPLHLRELHVEARGLGMECLVEVHNESELDSLQLSDVKIVGINNRNLLDFSVNLSTSLRLAARIPAEITVVSESGIATCSDLETLARHGIHAALVGESLMRAKDPGTALTALLSFPFPKHVRTFHENI